LHLSSAIFLCYTLPMPFNPARRTRNIWALITLLAILGILAPFLLDVDGLEGGFAVALICFFVAITGLIVIVLYQGRAKTLDSILSGSELLAHWTYSPEAWKNYTEIDFRKDAHAKWSLYRLVMVLAVVVCFVLGLIYQDAWAVMIGTFLGIGGLLAAVVVLTTNNNRRQNRRYLGEAYISRKGIYLNRQLHIWHGWGARLECAGYNEPERQLEVTYSVPARTGRNEFAVRVPVPDGEYARARAIASELGSVVQPLSRIP
jgi:hypothetical protein